eukprot:TRINITY_DN1421_c0_g1_i7.p1 TRINITY_DN1421_c0_g1~~TRINITY_DN1421_c0_g1_i7.p1  ORF type:complete len:123 (+),score=26.33 TRINITY_DN1421_c0_g1_i7:60-428(+)
MLLGLLCHFHSTGQITEPDAVTFGSFEDFVAASQLPGEAEAVEIPPNTNQWTREYIADPAIANIATAVTDIVFSDSMMPIPAIPFTKAVTPEQTNNFFATLGLAEHNSGFGVPGNARSHCNN